MSIAKAALSAVFALTAFTAVSSARAEVDPKSILLTLPDNIKWTAPGGALSVILQLLPIGSGSSLVWKLIGGPTS